MINVEHRAQIIHQTSVLREEVTNLASQFRATHRQTHLVVEESIRVVDEAKQLHLALRLMRHWRDYQRNMNPSASR